MDLHNLLHQLGITNTEDFPQLSEIEVPEHHEEQIKDYFEK